MDKTAIKNFSIWARNKLIADISYKAGLLGITEKGIKDPLPQSTQAVQFFDIGSREPYSISGSAIEQRKRLVDEINSKAKQNKYATAYESVIEEVAYTWFNRLIAIRFMEVNDYLPTKIRVLSSESAGKLEPDLVTYALEADLGYSAYEKDRITQLKHENKLDELFRILFIKQCNALNTILPELFEKTNDYTELLFNVSFTDKDGVVYHLANDIAEDDFNVSKEGQVEIIGWLYQYYNTEPKQAVFAGLKKNIKITKEKIPAATQLFTPNWIVRYMVENSLGRLWLESHPNDELKSNWRYYLDEAEQTPEVEEQLKAIRSQSPVKFPEDIRLIDPCMGSGHILVYAFDVLMQIYESEGYNPRDAARLILENNIYGLDIDRRAHQLAYFSLMMKARQYNRRVFSEDVKPQVYHPAGFAEGEEYGSLVKADVLPPKPVKKTGQMSFDDISYDTKLNGWNFQCLLAQKYDVVVTNPPYMGSLRMSIKMSDFVNKNYPDSKSDLFAVFIERCGKLLKPTGYQAMITQHTWMFLKSYEKLRSKLLLKSIVNMVHLGARAFEEIGGEVVQTTMFVLSMYNIANLEATYVRLLDYNSQQVKEEAFLSGENRYTEKKGNFEKIPGSPVAYWVGNRIVEIYAQEKLLRQFVDTKQGLKSSDDKRFFRLWTEVSVESIDPTIQSIDEAQLSRKKWVPLNKGGTQRWFGDNWYVINWENDGLEIKSYAKSLYKSVTRTITSMSYYFRESITWPQITSAANFRYIPTGFVFNAAGPSMFCNNAKYKWYILGLLNTKIVRVLTNILNPTINLVVTDLLNIPFIVDEQNIQIISETVQENVSLARADWDSFETSWDFVRHPLIQREQSLVLSFSKWENETIARFETLKANEEELNRIFIGIYGLEEELTPDVEDKNVTVRRADLEREICSLISYAIGCMFGRYSLDTEGLAYAGGKWDDSKYQTFIPDEDNIIPITDEEYFGDDIASLFVGFVKEVYGQDTLEENLNFIAEALGNRGSSSREIIRNYILRDFFKDHCKIYQKRPIYWLFDSGRQNGFKALVYMHRYDENTIGDLRIDYLHKMQQVYENEISRMQDTIDNSNNSREVNAANKRKEKLIKQLQETKEYDEKIAHLALARVPIDLDDGVKVNYEKVQTDRDGKKYDVLTKIR